MSPGPLLLPLTYSISNQPNGYSATVFDANGVAIDASLYEEQAAEIVNSCNHHHGLVAALRHARLGYAQLQNVKAHKATASAMIAVIDTALREAGA